MSAIKTLYKRICNKVHTDKVSNPDHHADADAVFKLATKLYKTGNAEQLANLWAIHMNGFVFESGFTVDDNVDADYQAQRKQNARSNANKARNKANAEREAERAAQKAESDANARARTEKAREQVQADIKQAKADVEKMKTDGTPRAQAKGYLAYKGIDGKAATVILNDVYPRGAMNVSKSEVVAHIIEMQKRCVSRSDMNAELCTKFGYKPATSSTILAHLSYMVEYANQVNK